MATYSQLQDFNVSRVKQRGPPLNPLGLEIPLSVSAPWQAGTAEADAIRRGVSGFGKTAPETKGYHMAVLQRLHNISD